ncbi:hypothetical protein RHSIM_Rhsim08G0155200 [Rhododendron simsii]|uniref:Uncharacterized protein n=1 Tax=Rhododendron simsii TaxID=118357 RepID=A0A834GMP4_RHOSS|nr:hypothetical protein RHSIM_Rhsim08G0155200 [Rhododendron simsii]
MNAFPILFEWGLYEKVRNATNQSSPTWLKPLPEKKVTKPRWPDFITQENYDVEGSSKRRTRFGSVARGIKAKHTRLDVEESVQKRTRFGSVARGIKAKHSRLRKHRDENKGEIREIAYHASLNGIKTLIEELNLSDEHKKIMKKTSFWQIFKPIIENKLTSMLCRKSDKMIIKIINAYDPDTGRFKLGSKTISITRDNIFSIFGIRGGSEKVSFKYGSREGVGIVRRGSIKAVRLSSSSLKELVKEYSNRNNKIDREDFVRLMAILDEFMTSIRQHHDDPRRGSRYVVILLLCEHTNLVKSLHSEESLNIIKWRTMDLVKEFREVQLNELKSDQVVTLEPNVRDTHTFSGNIDNGGAILLRDKSGNEGRNGSAKEGNETECSKRNYTLVTGNKGASVRTPWTPKVGCNLEHIGVDVLNEGSVHTECGADAVARSSDIWDSGPSIEYIGNPTEHDHNSRLIGELHDHIAKMKHQMKRNEEMHAREIAIKDQEIDSLNETVFILLSDKSQLMGELIEMVVHGVTQNYKPMTSDEQERSMITRLRARTRKDTKKKIMITDVNGRDPLRNQRKSTKKKTLKK